MVAVQDLSRLRQVNVLGLPAGPGQRCNEIQVVVERVVLGPVGRLLLEPSKDAQSLLPDILRHAAVLDLVGEGVFLLPGLGLHVVELLLQDPDLLLDGRLLVGTALRVIPVGQIHLQVDRALEALGRLMDQLAALLEGIGLQKSVFLFRGHVKELAESRREFIHGFDRLQVFDCVAAAADIFRDLTRRLLQRFEELPLPLHRDVHDLIDSRALALDHAAGVHDPRDLHLLACVHVQECPHLVLGDVDDVRRRSERIKILRLKLRVIFQCSGRKNDRPVLIDLNAALLLTADFSDIKTIIHIREDHRIIDGENHTCFSIHLCPS